MYLDSHHFIAFSAMCQLWHECCSSATTFRYVKFSLSVHIMKAEMPIEVYSNHHSCFVATYALCAHGGKDFGFSNLEGAIGRLLYTTVAKALKEKEEKVSFSFVYAYNRLIQRALQKYGNWLLPYSVI